MILNLDFSKLVNIGNFLFKKDFFVYQHDIYILKDSQIKDKYYLIDHIKNVTKIKDIEDLYKKVDCINLEEIYILDLSLKKDIPAQIVYFLKSNNYIEDIDSVIDILKSIDISYFEVRYKFYERSRVVDVDSIESGGEVYCNYSRIRVVNKDNTLGVVIEDISLNSIKKLLYVN